MCVVQYYCFPSYQRATKVKEMKSSLRHHLTTSHYATPLVPTPIRTTAFLNHNGNFSSPLKFTQLFSRSFSCSSPLLVFVGHKSKRQSDAQLIRKRGIYKLPLYLPKNLEARDAAIIKTIDMVCIRFFCSIHLIQSNPFRKILICLRSNWKMSKSEEKFKGKLLWRKSFFRQELLVKR